MEKCLLIRYGEIYLKGKNRKFFEDLLQNNLQNAAKPYNAVVSRIPGRFLLTGYRPSDEKALISCMKKQAGIFSLSDAYCIDSNLDAITNLAVNLMQDEAGTFKVETNRADKTFPLNSMEISSHVGGKILEANKALSVDVINPEKKINIDLRENKKTYIFKDTIMGVGGMPVGCAGDGLLLLSGGIDSPVAGYMMAKRGTKLHAIHFHSFPYTSELARLKVEELAKKLAEFNAGDLEVFMCSMTHYQEEINKSCKSDYNITLLRRAMFKIAERLCKEKGFKMIITGESLGQVASQTIESMTVVGNIVKDTQIMRPLIAFDKNETIEISRKIDCYDISIRPYEDCCTIFVPKSPVIKPRLENVEAQEKLIEFDRLVDEAYSTIEKVVIKAKEK